jgi:uncharacterized membrane protein
MESKARHPVHPMLIVFPLGLLATAVVFDVAHLFGAGPTMVAVAYWTMAAGIVGALVAAPFGTIDWLAIPAGTRAKRIGGLHGIGNLVVSALFIADDAHVDASSSPDARPEPGRRVHSGARRAARRMGAGP